MFIPGILSGLSDLATLGKRAESDTKSAGVAKAATADAAQPAGASDAMREIVSRYDVTDISPNDFSKLIQQLYDKGAISQKDLQELSSIRVDLENAGVGSDDSVNLVNFYQQKLTQAQTDAAKSGNAATAQPNLDSLLGRLKWVAKFAAVRQERSGVNAVA